MRHITVFVAYRFEQDDSKQYFHGGPVAAATSAVAQELTRQSAQFFVGGLSFVGSEVVGSEVRRPLVIPEKERPEG